MENNEEKLDEYYDSLENDLTLVVAVFFEEILKEGVKEMISTLKFQEKKIFLITSDNLSRVVPTAYNCCLLKEKTDILYLTDKNREGVQLTLSNNFRLIKNFYFQNLNKENLFENLKKRETLQIHDNKIDQEFCLLVSDSSLNLIKNDPFLLNHFAFLCSFCDSVICFELKLENKIIIVDMIKKFFLNNPRVLSIGIII